MKKITTTTANTIDNAIIDITKNNNFETENNATARANSGTIMTSSSSGTFGGGPRRKTYEYKFNIIGYNHSARTDDLCDRLTYWLQKNRTSAWAFGKYLEEYSKKTPHRVSKYNVYNYINRRCCPKIDHLTVMANAMGVTVGWLTGYGPREKL